MNATDKAKFIDVCVEITKYGKVVKCASSDIDVIISRIDESVVNGFEKFLFDKANDPEFEDPDVWDEWYDNLTLDEISDKDIQVYDLPTKKIEIAFGNEETFVRAVYNAAKEYFDTCRSFVKPEKHNLHVGYDFAKNGIFVHFISRGDTRLSAKVAYDASIRTKIDECFTKFIDKTKAAKDAFNEAQGKDGVHAGIAIYRNDDVEPNCHTARCLYITKEDLFYENKMTVPDDYVYQMFSYVLDEIEY